MKKTLIASALLSAGLAFAGLGHASTFSFYNLTNNTTDIGSQLSMVVADNTATAATNDVTFTFYNNVGTSSSIAQVYWDLGATADLTGIVFGSQSAGVNYAMGGTPENLPGGNTISFTADWWASANNPAPRNGVSTNAEWVTFIGTLASGETLENLVADFMSGAARAGMHVISINGGTSDAYVTGPSQVPLPGAAWLFGSALLGFMAVANRRRV